MKGNAYLHSLGKTYTQFDVQKTPEIENIFLCGVKNIIDSDLLDVTSRLLQILIL